MLAVLQESAFELERILEWNTEEFKVDPVGRSVQSERMRQLNMLVKTDTHAYNNLKYYECNSNQMID